MEEWLLTDLSARLSVAPLLWAGAATRTGLRCGIPDGDGQRAAEGVDAHDGGVRMAGGQGSEWCRRARGAVQSLGHVRRTFQEELLRRQERGTAGAAAGAESEPGAPRAGRRAEAPYLVTAGHSIQGLRQVSSPFQQHFLGQGRRQNQGAALRVTQGPQKGFLTLPTGHPYSWPIPLSTLGSLSGSPGCLGMTFCSLWNP